MNDFYWASFDCEIQCDEFDEFVFEFEFEYDPVDDDNLPF